MSIFRASLPMKRAFCHRVDRQNKRFFPVIRKKLQRPHATEVTMMLARLLARLAELEAAVFDPKGFHSLVMVNPG